MEQIITNCFQIDVQAKVSEVYVGADAFEIFKDALSIHPLVEAYVADKFEFTRPAFMTNVTVNTHPLFTGIGEK